MLDIFLEGIPEVKQKHIDNLRKQNKWKNFIAKCTDGGKSGSFTQNPFESNEKEFSELVQCIASLEELGKSFGKRELNDIRISHQGNHPMTTWNPKAKWLDENRGTTPRKKELKPDLMSIVVEDVEEVRPRQARRRKVQLAKPQTILPPPQDWRPPLMDDESFPIVECKEPVWECLDLFWECKRNSQALKHPEVYLDCGLKAAEALRYQWSRRYVYCFLHCGTMMQLLHFDRSGLMASDPVDIRTDTDRFVRCLRAVFYHNPSRFGYPAGKDAPFHLPGPDNRLLQVVTVDDRKLYIDDQQAGPPRDHLVSRATVVFKAKLVHPEEDDKTGWDWCYKSSWVQKLQKHEGIYLEHLKGLPNVVELLVYGVVKVEKNDDTTVNGRQCSSGQSMTLLEDFFDRAKKQGHDFVVHSTTASASVTDDQEDMDVLFDPRRPKGESSQNCDNREHRDVVTAWVNSSFNEAASSLGSLPTTLSIWQQAFSAIKSICEKGVVHRDISFRNIRIDDEHKIKVCDFDMAIFRNDQPSGAQDRTGTIAFMATAMLGPELRIHRPIHDCESIFWLLALNLLSKVSIGRVKMTLANMMHPGKDIVSVGDMKRSILYDLISVQEGMPGLEFSYSLDNSEDASLFFCLAALAREFHQNGFARDYMISKEFEEVCFDCCMDIIQEALDLAVQQATKGIAGMSISSKRKAF